MEEMEMVNLLGHQHPLCTRYSREQCIECGKWINGQGYFCMICFDDWHKECIATTPEINHPFHQNHPLKLLIDGAPSYTDGKCHFCQAELENVAYHCFTCNFTLDLKCVVSPRQVTIDESKCHNHPLTLMARQVSFFCNVCGTHGDRNPYVCLSCSFMVHESCINRPHVININRHDHRISHTHDLVFGNRVCRVCRLGIDWIYGVYSCSKCPDFVLHSKCATSSKVWDGVELQGVPEEEEEEPMFKVIEENVINHQMHPSHNLRLVKDSVARDETVRCQLCDGLAYSDKLYSCLECNYVLHQTCAYLTHRKRHSLSSSRISLNKGAQGQAFFKCAACKQLSSGHRYVIPNNDKLVELDLRCASIDWSCNHESHPHTLFLTNLDEDTCGACEYIKDYVLRCVECKFNLDYKCASYPKKIQHRCDDHPLILSYGNADQQGPYWCTVCETKADPKKWFYECEECGIFCHIRCVLGDFANVKPEEDGNKRGVVRNNSVTRPHCHCCGIRCLFPFVYRVSENYFCSYACLEPDSQIQEETLHTRKKQLELKVQELMELHSLQQRNVLKSREMISK